MTEEEKEAENLINLYLNMSYGILKEYLPKPEITAIKAALITVDEILKAVTTIADKKYEFYIKVKQILENKLK